MIKPVTYQGIFNFNANLYALEIKSRFIDQEHANGYYRGYGSELMATVVSNQIKIGTGAFVIQGRMNEITEEESVVVPVGSGSVGYIVTRIETYHPSDEENCTLTAVTANSFDEIGLRQEDTYSADADTQNKVYELPIYSFEISGGNITNLTKLIEPVEDYAKVMRVVDLASQTAQNAFSAASTALQNSQNAIQTANDANVKADTAAQSANNVVTRANNGDFDGLSVFIRYSAHADGSGMTEGWSIGQNYIGIYNGASAPADPKSYIWTQFLGNVSEKADKAPPIVAGNLAALDADGNLQDSGESMGTLKELAKQYADAALGALNRTHRYTVRWNKTTSQMTRMNDAASITTDTTNFAHRGTVNPNYDNPFDDIYPWSGRKLCNISIDRYLALTSGDSLTKCVRAWEGDPDFSYTHSDGVWVYTPAFWGRSWEDGTYRYFEVTDQPLGGYVSYPERIEGRWHGREQTRTVNGEQKLCLLPSVGMPAKRIRMSTLHSDAKNYGATLDSIFSIDASLLLMVVEFASMNSQTAIGNGVSALCRQNKDKIAQDATDSKVIKLLKSAASSYCFPDSILDIGTADGGVQIGSYIVKAVEEDLENTLYLNVTLDRTVTVTTGHYWSIHGLINRTDEEIGSKSGYIGVNGRSNAYYRGMVLYGDLWFYTLGVYESYNDNTGENMLFLANDEEAADALDTLDYSLCRDTWITLPGVSGYIQNLALLPYSGMLSVPVFCTAVGGNSSHPVGDHFYNTKTTDVDTVLLRGGRASNGTEDGAFCASFEHTPSYSYWNISARPCLKRPK